MPLTLGQVLKGHKGSYKLVEALKGASVFKARLLPAAEPSRLSSSTALASFVVIKTEPVESRKVIYTREWLRYQCPSISSSPYIRELIDLVGHDDEKGDDVSSSSPPDCLVLKWMDNTLATVSPCAFRSHSVLPQTIAKSVLEALTVFHAEELVHTDLNPNNVFLSGHDGPTPVVTLGDLGNGTLNAISHRSGLSLICLVVDQGYASTRLQSIETRAPEVWCGMGCHPASDVWSLGVTLVHWLSGKLIFGPSGKPFKGMNEAWSIAKLIRLIGPLGPIVHRDHLEEFATAQALESHRSFPKLASLRQELERLPGSKISEETIDFILFLLAIDPMERPSAAAALEHPWIKSIS